MYKQIFAIRGTLSFSLSGALARSTMSTISLSMVLCLNMLYNTWVYAGMMSAAYIISAAAVTPIYARLFDRFGQRKVGYSATYMQFISLSLFAFAAHMRAPLPVMYALAVFVGVTMYSVGAVVRTRWAWALRDKDEKYLNTAYAYEAAVDELIFIFGPILAAFVSTTINPMLPFILFGSMNAIGGTIFYSLRSAVAPSSAVQSVREVDVDVQADTQSMSSHYHEGQYVRQRNVLTLPGIAVLLVAVAIFNMSFTSFDVTMTAILKTMGQSSLLGLVLSMIAFGSLLGAIIFGSIQVTVNPWIRMMCFMGVIALGFAGIAMAIPHLVLVAMCEVAAGVMVAPTFATANLVVKETVPPQSLTEGLSWISTAATVGASMGSALAGLAIEHTGAHNTMHWIWIASMCALPFFFWGYMQQKAARVSR